MAKKSNLKVGHHVMVDDSQSFYNGCEVVITDLHNGFASVLYKGNTSFSIRNIHLKYNQYQD